MSIHFSWRNPARAFVKHPPAIQKPGHFQVPVDSFTSSAQAIQFGGKPLHLAGKASDEVMEAKQNLITLMRQHKVNFNSVMIGSDAIRLGVLDLKSFQTAIQLLSKDYAEGPSIEDYPVTIYMP